MALISLSLVLFAKSHAKPVCILHIGLKIFEIVTFRAKKPSLPESIRLLSPDTFIDPIIIPLDKPMNIIKFVMSGTNSFNFFF